MAFVYNKTHERIQTNNPDTKIIKNKYIVHAIPQLELDVIENENDYFSVQEVI